MKYLIAIFFPFVSFFYIKKPISGYFCFVFQILAFLGVSIYPNVGVLFAIWFLLILWAFFEISDFNNKQNTRRIVKRIVTSDLKLTNKEPKVVVEQRGSRYDRPSSYSENNSNQRENNNYLNNNQPTTYSSNYNYNSTRFDNKAGKNNSYLSPSLSNSRSVSNIVDLPKLNPIRSDQKNRKRLNSVNSLSSFGRR